MKTMHNITITVFIESEENETLIAENIATFLPEHFVDETQSNEIANAQKSKISREISMEIDTIRIEEGRDIKSLKVYVEKERHTKFVLSQLKEALGEEQCALISEQENRVDEKGKLFIRIDKTEFIEHNDAILTDSGNCIHFNITIAAYPKNRSRALEIVKEMFS